jgi:transcriptional regulator with XRE-family HTH domain
MNNKYIIFREEFIKSGLTQRKFAEQKGISASMVSYYLKRSKEVKAPSIPSFAKLKIVSAVDSKVVITMPNGVVVELPL